MDPSDGPTFYYKDDKTKTPIPIYTANSDCPGTSLFCVEGYVNTPELSAQRRPRWWTQPELAREWLAFVAL